MAPRPKLEPVNRKKAADLKREAKKFGEAKPPAVNRNGRKKNVGGRPTKMTTETLDKLRQAFLLGCTDDEACLVADIAPITLYAYQKITPGYAKQKEIWKKYPNMLARKSLVDHMPKRPEIALGFLKSKLPLEFNERMNYVHEGALTVDLVNESENRARKYDQPTVAEQQSDGSADV